MKKIRTTNKFQTSNPNNPKNYRRLRKHWKLFSKDSNELNYTDYRYQQLFKSILIKIKIMDYSLNLNKELTETYKLYRNLLYCCKTNNFGAFSDLLLLSTNLIFDQMVITIKTLKRHLSRIKNTFRFSYSNESSEDSINKIKLIKQTIYGYRISLNFTHPHHLYESFTDTID